MEYKVGNQAFLAGTLMESQVVTVEKVGKKYAYLKEVHGRVDMKNHYLKYKAYTLGRIYTSEQEYQDHIRKVNLVQQLRSKISNINPDKFTLDQIKDVYTILGLEIR